VREGVLERYPDEALELFVIWTNVLDTDVLPGAERAAAVFDDPRVHQFYDPERTLGRALAESISMPTIREVCEATGEELSLYEGIMAPSFITGPAAVFDTVFFYEPGVRWPEADGAVPEHVSWVTQLDPEIYVGVDPERYRFGVGLKAEVGSLAGALFAEVRRKRSPSVLLVLADDLRTDLGCFGGSAESPRLDALAEEGRLFIRAYAQSPESNHSRVSLMSGVRPPGSGSFERGFWPELDLVMLPELFAAGGYETFKAGKILPNVRRKRLQREASGSEAHDRRIWSRAIQAVLARSEKKAVRTEKSLGAGITLGTHGVDFLDHHDGRVAEAASRFLRERSPGEGPFFLAVGFSKPRLPFVVPEPYLERVGEIELRVEEVSPGDLDDVPERALDEVLVRDVPTREERLEAVRAYLASVAYLDECVGRLLDGLRAGGHANDTIVIVTSDGGQLLGEHDLWKGSVLFEEALHVPLWVSLPDGMIDPAPGGGAGPCDRLVELVDLYPTLAELCGLPRAPELEGTSLVPLLRDPQRPWKPRVFSHLKHGDSLRSEEWRLTRWDDGTFELYDHRSGDGERTNLSTSSGFGSTLARLARELEQGWRASLPE